MTQRRRQLANLVVAGYAAASTPKFRSLLEGTRTDIEALETELARRGAAFRVERNADRVGYAEVRSGLDADDVLVSFAKHVRSTFARLGATATQPVATDWVRRVRRHAAAPEPIAIPLASAAWSRTSVHRWRAQLLAETSTAPAAKGPSSRALGAQLRCVIWDPVAKQLANARRVFVVPDGALSLIPLGALPSAAGRYLIDDGPLIHVLTTERDLFADVSTRTPNKDSSQLAGRRSHQGRRSRCGHRRSRLRKAGCVVGYRCPRIAAMAPCGSTPLPGSRTEAEQTERLWTTLHPWVRMQGTPSSLLEIQPPSRPSSDSAPGIACFISQRMASSSTPRATPHRPARAPSEVWSGRPSGTAKREKVARRTTSCCFWARAGRGESDVRRGRVGDDDGISDRGGSGVPEPSAGVEWAVLSACDTGLGTISAGEGASSASGARFVIAGVGTVMMSLWPVGDRTAQQWTELLYRARLSEGLDSASSAWLATKRLLERRRLQRQSTNPFYWADSWPPGTGDSPLGATRLPPGPPVVIVTARAFVLLRSRPCRVRRRLPPENDRELRAFIHTLDEIGGRRPDGHDGIRATGARAPHCRGPGDSRWPQGSGDRAGGPEFHRRRHADRRTGTGLLGAWVSDRIQQRSTANELERAERQQRLNDRKDSITKALRIVGASISTTDELLVTINTAYDEKRRSLDEAKALRTWKAEIARAREKADLEWRLEKRSLGYTVQYLFEGDETIGRMWKGLAERADLFEQCTRTLYEEKASTGTPLGPDTICQDERATSIESIEQFLAQVTRHKA